MLSTYFASRNIQIFSARSTTPSPNLARGTNSLSTVLDANKFLMDAADAAVLASADGSDSGIGSSENLFVIIVGFMLY